MSIKEWMDEENTAYMYNGILFSLVKQGNTVISYNMNKSWRHYAKWNKSVTGGQIIHDST